MTLAHHLLQLLPHISDLLLHHGPRHTAVRNPRVPQVLSLLAHLQMRVRHSRHLLLVLPDQIRHVAHGHGQQGPGSHGTEGQRGRCAQEDTAVPRHDGTGHGGHNDVHSAGEQAFAGLGRRGQGGDGVGEGVFDVQGTRQEVVELSLDGQGVLVQEETGLTDLSGQDVGGSRGRGRGEGSGHRSCRGGGGRSRGDDGLGDGRDLGREVIVDRFFLDVISSQKQIRAKASRDIPSTYSIARLLCKSRLPGVEGDTASQKGGRDGGHSPLEGVSGNFKLQTEETGAEGFTCFSIGRKDMMGEANGGKK